LERSDVSQTTPLDGGDCVDENEDEISEQDDGAPLDNQGTDYSPQEIRRILNNIKMWASVTFINEMVASCRLLNKEPESVANTIKELIELANKNLLAKPYHPKVIFKYKNVAINATLLVQRLRDMDILRNAVAQYENPVQFKLPVLLPVWVPFRDFWGP
jgi:hypothetical protein